MKRIIAILLSICCLFGLLAGCGTQNNPEQTQESTREPVVRDKKKVIFIGNSYTYYGNCVLDKGQKVFSQAERVGDQGYFYQLCKANNFDVEVTNFCFGGHRLEDFKGNCMADRGHDGYNHLQDLVDTDYDYVFLQESKPSSPQNTDIVELCQWLMDIFKEGNPNVKFFLLVPWYAYEGNYAWLPTVKNLEEMGVTVVDWGKLVYDIIHGNTTVPGATYTYDKNSLIIYKEANDGYHPNMLTGYITALMAYCAITGESAVGQPYAFATDTNINPIFNTNTYTFKNYCYGTGVDTNYAQILQSAEDMKGIQQLIDQYMAE